MKKKNSKHINGLIVFIKNPEEGKVKTRIAKTEGNAKALDIYNKLITICLKNISTTNTRRLLYFTDYIDNHIGKVSDNVERYIQEGEDLGEKMSNAIRNSLKNNQKILLIGSDCPYLNGIHIQNALKALDEHDVVIGPTYDGGYYLIGMKKHQPKLFEDIQWSTENVMTDTIKKLNTESLSYFLLEKLNDIDYIEDWKEYLKVS